MTNKLVVTINSLKVPKIKKTLLYETKFLVPNYSCFQNPWLEGYRPQIPVLSVLRPQLNLLNPPPTEQNSWIRHCYREFIAKKTLHSATKILLEPCLVRGSQFSSSCVMYFPCYRYHVHTTSRSLQHECLYTTQTVYSVQKKGRRWLPPDWYAFMTWLCGKKGHLVVTV